MVKALLIKECRENLWLGAVALTFLLFDLAVQTRWDGGFVGWQLERYDIRHYSSEFWGIPFTLDSFSRTVPAVAALLD